jgi:ABC-type nitrate/sulfonate/bicarbonate transport system substrate-binding protein
VIVRGFEEHELCRLAAFSISCPPRPGAPTDRRVTWHFACSPLAQDGEKMNPFGQMETNMKVDAMHGFCVGEPWGARAVADEIGCTAIAASPEALS